MRILDFGKCGLLSLVSFAAISSCGKKKSTSTDSTNETTVITHGITAAAKESAVKMTGALNLSSSGLNLSTTLPDKVLAFPVIGGQFQSTNDTLSTAVDADGSFSLELTKVPPTITKIAAAKKSDGTYDRSLVSEIVGQTIDSSITDAQISAYIEEVKTKAASAGINWILVAMTASATGDKEAEAKSMKFIGLGTAGSVISNIPVGKAKGDIGLGKVAITSSDDAYTEVLPSEALDISADTLKAMSSTNSLIKTLKNVHINGTAYKVMPFFLWNQGTTELNTGFSDANKATYSGYGMYLGINNSTTKFSDICGTAAKAITLTPPSEIDAGVSGKISAARPFNNANRTEIKNESTRQNCGGSDTGFYGAGKDANATDLMLNWGTGGSIKGLIPEGFWTLAQDGTKLASFELASSAPFDSAGKPRVFLPSVKVTTDGNNKITAVEAKLFYLDSAGNFVQLTDITPFKSSVQSFNVEMVNYGNSGSTDARYSLLEKESGGIFSVDVTGLDSNGTQHAWKYFGASEGADEKAVTSIAVYYELFGSSYRVDFRTNYN